MKLVIAALLILSFPSRPPRGGRGLKYKLRHTLREARQQSPPSRGAWIEITCWRWTGPYICVAPLAGGVD